MNDLGLDERISNQLASNYAQAQIFSKNLQDLDKLPGVRPKGRVSQLVGASILVKGLSLPVGGLCSIAMNHGRSSVLAEVVSFKDDVTYLMPYDKCEGLEQGSLVSPLNHNIDLPFGPELLGRTLNALGQPIDGRPLEASQSKMLHIKPINPLHRQPIQEPFDVGLRSINTLLTLGKGQRVGLFAGSGVGKSVLIGMMTRFSQADVIVVGLIGERGREVNEFIHHTLGEEGLKKSVIVASPADETPLKRIKSAETAAFLAQQFRDQGLNVLLIMDSLTRYAQAYRELGLATGEPPVSKGYPPSVFAKLPALVEMAGNGASEKGSLTAVYTVLTEGDDLQDPVADCARAILDGHIVLSRSLAEEGIYPAIDIETSVSRCMSSVVSEEQEAMARLFKKLYVKYNQAKDLLQMGAYAPGNDQETDLAIEKHEMMLSFLGQSRSEPQPMRASLEALMNIFKVQA
jgi:flagellum-specific ATP synthase